MAGLMDQLKRAARLPSPPGAALRILQLTQQEEWSMVEVAETLASDPALSIRILKYANSALIGVSRDITTVREAVVLLGMRSVRMMALSFSLVSKRDARACPGFDYERFWARSLAWAVAARHLAVHRNQTRPDEAFAAGLLANIGKLVFAVAMPAEYAELLKSVGGFESDTAALEQQRFGMTHNRAGAELMSEWGIPDRLCTVVRYQSNPQGADLSPGLTVLAEVINEAGGFVDTILAAHSDADKESGDASENAPASVGGMGFSEMVRVMRLREYRELASILGMDATTELDTDQIQAEAGEVLSELSLAAQLHTDAVEREKKDLQKLACATA